MIEYKVSEKKAKSMIYDNLTKHLPPSTKRNTIVKQTQRARDIYKLFEKIGIDKIRYITTYSANSITELSDSQIQTIVDYFSKNPNTELPDDQDVSDIDSEEGISDEVSLSTIPIPLFHDSNSSGESKVIGPDNPSKANDYDDLYYDDPMSPSMEKGTNEIKSDDENDENDSEEMQDESDNDDGYDGYGGYNEYGECDRGYYYHDGEYERKTSPMMSPIISPVTA